MIIMKDIFRSIKNFRQGPIKALPIKNVRNESLEPLKNSSINELPHRETELRTVQFKKFVYLIIFLTAILSLLCFALTTYKIIYDRENSILRNQMKYQGQGCGMMDDENIDGIDMQMQYGNDNMDASDYRTLSQVPEQEKFLTSIEKILLEQILYDTFVIQKSLPQTSSDIDVSEEYSFDLPALDDSNVKNSNVNGGDIFVNFLQSMGLPQRRRVEDQVKGNSAVVGEFQPEPSVYFSYKKVLGLKNDQNFFDQSKRTVESKQCSNMPTVLRFDCHPEDGTSQSSCEERGCCWAPADPAVAHSDEKSKRVPLNIPYCYYPVDWTGYEFINGSRDDNDFTGFLKLRTDSFYKKDVPVIKMEATSLDEAILRVKIYDPVNPRYEPPWPIRPDKEPYVPTTKFTFETDALIPGFRVNRAADNVALFDSVGKGGFIFADQFLQISALLPTHNIYGLGEHRTKLKLSTDWQSFTMFNQGQPPIEQANLYGSHPFYLAIEESGNCHGVLFLNSNAMDVILQPTPAITFRTIGGIFDIYFFMGPTPSDVMKQYSEIVGKPFLPPYWSLGFHLSRFGYGNLQRTKEAWNRTLNASIPFDTQWNDIDYMDQRNDFTYDKENFKELPAFVEELHDIGMHYIPIIDAGISASEANGSYPPYDMGLKQDIFIKDASTGLPFSGKVWNRVSTVWPDFTNPKTESYWLNMMENLHENISYDGAWIDMNEPSNFYNGRVDGCPRNDFDNPKYLPNVIGNLMASQTLCMNAKHYLGPHYNLHNTYGISQAIATNNALKSIRKKRPFIISRSTWVGHGVYAGHWTGDNLASWHDLQMSIPQILAYNLFQIPMVGADICGFRGNTTEALCNRWMQVGAFYPFSRNHNSDDAIDQDPVAMGESVVASSREALMIRYRFLPYLYTLFFRAHKFGETVARPLFFEFVDDPATYDIDAQFLWGSSFMIVPVLEEDITKVNAYLPRGLWYDFYTKSSVFSTGRNFNIPAPFNMIPLLIRGGTVLPAQTPATTTTGSRKKNFELLVALDEGGFAKGELYWDDGDSLDSLEEQQFRWLMFTVENQTLKNHEIEHGLYNGDMVLGKISIMGVDRRVDRVLLNGIPIGFNYDKNRSYLNVKNLIVNVKEDFVLSWKYV